MADFKTELNVKINNFQEYLKEYFDIKTGYQQNIIEAMKYSLLNGGKRMRAMLVLGFYSLTENDEKKAYPFAAALEMIHSYSLIHDDLPCMDNDDIRRGVPSNHKVFGEAMALLAGDSLLTEAFKIISNEKNNFSSSIIVDATLNLSESAGFMGMIGGQVIDIESENQKIDEEKLAVLHKLKTGALIKCAAKMGIICAGGTEKQIDLALKYGEKLGLAFQIQDDILDVIGEEKLLGKPIGSDEKQNKTTYVTIYGIEKAKEKCDLLYEDALLILKELGGNNEFLINLTLMLKNRKY